MATLETNDYWICNDNTLVFKPKFNQPLHTHTFKYDDVISKCVGLVFSDYDNFNVCENTIECVKNYVGSIFNHPVDLEKYTNITDISFGLSFNNNLLLPLFLTKLKFGYHFNQPVILPESLISLTFGLKFNQPVKLPPLLTRLTIGFDFVYPIDLPFEIKYLSLNCNNKYLIDNLPDGIEILELRRNFNLEIQNLPSTIKSIIFNKDSEYDMELNCLPTTINLIQLPRKYTKLITNIPTHLKKIICFYKYQYIHLVDKAKIEIETYN